MLERLFIGVDPGKLGGIAIIDVRGNVIRLTPMPSTRRDVLQAFDIDWNRYEPAATLERVSAFPKMGVVSAFTFGGGYERLAMALTALDIPFDEVVPARWQRALGCMTQGNKNISKARAEALFPATKFTMKPAPRITHAVADSLLLAEYGRRLEITALRGQGVK